MATQTALAGVGLAAMAAAVLGNEPSTAVATGTGSQANAVLIKSSLARLTAAGGTDAFILPASTAWADEIGKPYFLLNTSGTTAVVFVPVGATLINAGASTLNGSLSVTNNKIALAIQVAKNVWALSLLP
jgi:hypothetical protein